MKKLFALFCLFLVTGCSNEKNSIKETNSALMNLNYDGLSAYEIYCKNYIYLKPEKTWIKEYTEGTLDYIDNSVLEEKRIFTLNENDDFSVQ